MKKLLSIILALAVLLSLTACGSKEPTLPTDASEPTSALVAVAPALSIGTINNNVFESNFLNLAINFSSEWTLNEDMVLQYNGVERSAITEEYITSLGEDFVLYDLYADHSAGDNIFIMYQPLPSDFESMAGLLEQMDAELKTSYTEAGGSVTASEILQTEIAGEIYDCLYATVTYMDVTIYQRIYMLQKGDYIATLTVSSINSDNIDSLLASISALN